MRTPSNSELIAVWERGSGEGATERALSLLGVCTGESREELARLSIGTRDTLLLELYERLFGTAMDAFARCPECAEPLEYSLSTRELAVAAPSVPSTPLVLQTGSAVLTLRLPDSRDLAAVSDCSDVRQASRLLAERCVVSAEWDQDAAAADTLPDEVIDAIGTALTAADPGAEMLIDLACPACCHHWQVALDVERFLWPRISAVAKGLLREVHGLASVYGWNESEILGLSSTRRQLYLEMACPTF